MQLSTILSVKGAFVATISPEATVHDLAARLTQHGVGALVVSTDGQRISGIVSERDVVRALASGPRGLKQSVSSIMTPRVITARPQAHVDELMHVMTEKRVRHIPVINEEGLLVGIVSIGDIVKTRLDELEVERARLLEYITQS
ncbi:MAG TPA: histidine kinase [Actinobacteria bacterium]|jgi:CBS domain-containing protein|nr:histidine kinase [Actinomycetota bacterium]